MLVGGFVIFSLIYLTGYVYRISLAERFVFFIMFSLQMAASRICREWFSPLPLQQDPRKITASFLVCFILLGMIIQTIFVGTKFITPAVAFKPGSAFPTYVTPNALQSELKNYLSDQGRGIIRHLFFLVHSRVHGGKNHCPLPHLSPHRDNTERKKAVETFYDSSTSPEARKAILKRYGVTHLLLNFQTAGKALEPVLREMGFEVVARNESFCLFSVSTRSAPSLTRAAH